ncbi:hypothetical protein IAT38_005526 [Cryptococcus sp. DSM 104549]
MCNPQDDPNYAAIRIMHERQASWGRPTGSASPSSNSPDSLASTDSHSGTPQLHNFINQAHAPHDKGRAGSSGSGGGGAVGSGSGSGSASASVGPASASGSGRGRPKSSTSKPKPKGLDSERKARKKVAKACLACQKSHLTCDEQRPCTRCVKKGIPEQCVEGVRKKAKYLMEGDERTMSGSRADDTGSLSPAINAISSSSVSLPTLHNNPNNEPMHISDDMWLTTATQQDDRPPSINLSNLQNPNQMWNPNQQPDITPSSYPTFGGTAANNEYQMLDAMFASLSPIYPGIADPLDEAGRQLGMDANMVNNPPLPGPQFDQSWLNPSPSATNTSQNQGGFGGPTPGSGITSLSPGTYSEISPNNQTWGSGGWVDNQQQQQQHIPLQGQMMLDGTGGPQDQMDSRLMPTSLRRVGKGLTSAEVYRTKVKPYDYTQGYHILMDYLTKNFESSDVLRVVRALASFRPSLIALQMPMSEEDEVFLERSFQRTLIELEKLISYSATPTAVWRRTGEVCYANPEFCKLVDRTDADLLGRKTYIYELFAKSSVVTYWENFSVHAFENTTQNFFQPISLVGATGLSQCTCCFTIRRDVFDLPSVVIGQFLPIPIEAQNIPSQHMSL